MFSEIILKYVYAAAVVVGACVGFLSFLSRQRAQRSEIGKVELDALALAHQQFNTDEYFQRFIENIRKEKLSELAFGCGIPNSELGRLMDFYMKGVVTISEIGQAWPYRVRGSGSLTFELSRLQKFLLWVIVIYSSGCLVFAAIGIALIPLPWFASIRWFIGYSAAFLAAAGYTAIWFNRDLFAAARLEKLGRGSS